MMETHPLCRLCVEICSNCQNLYDDEGNSTHVYETIVKYFDPMLLNLDMDQKNTVICFRCWRSISDFHEFQQIIYNAQKKFSLGMDQTTDIKPEDDKLNDQLSEDVVEDDLDDEDMLLVGLEISVEGDDGNNSLTEECSEENSDSVEIESENEYSRSGNDINGANGESRRSDKIHDRSEKGMSFTFKEDNTQDHNSGEYGSEDEYTWKELQGKTRMEQPTIKSHTMEAISEHRRPNEKNIPDAENMSFTSEEDSQDGNISQPSYDDDHSDTKTPTENDKYARQRKIQEIDEFIAKWKKDLECVVCSELYPNVDTLRRHFRECHPKHYFHVICCQIKLRHRSHIYEHIRIHLDPSAFKCDVCGKCFKTSENMNKHKVQKHTAKGQQLSFECSMCQKRFYKKWALKHHMNTHKTGTDYVCEECGKGFATDEIRKLHERRVHNIDRVCDQCGKTLHGAYALRQHLLDHQGIKKPKWPCDICKAQLSSHSSLKRHKKVAHTDGSTVYICGECGKIAATEEALQKHKSVVHRAERKYKCTICDKAFKTAVYLREHMTTHTGESLYTCPHCPTKFRARSNMYHHRKKAHPKEWAESRLNRPIIAKVDINQVSNEVVM
ncbi:zinc finger protein 816-like [Musca domestica]|uniref:Zinc finger protein 816-like n=1 Tax=Musca domestica TaxID=7370 RepID=A0A9J7DE46_MUSDO|nr:zinc finger protein 816-like [Musca domestica]